MSISVVIDAPAGYPSPDVARFVWQLEDQTSRMLRDLAGITPEELEWQVAPGVNTVGMLLAHIAIAEVYWTQAVLEEATFDSQGVLGIGPDDDGMPLPAGAPPPPGLAGKDLGYFADLLQMSRERVLAVARAMQATDLHRQVMRPRRSGDDAGFSKEWTLYHLVEHEAAHYGQIMLLRHLYRMSNRQQAS
jgi:uncharacterized damage-inducible protein DinB